MAKMKGTDIIKRFMYSLDKTSNISGKEALDEAVSYATGGYFTELATAINRMVADCKSLGADKFLLNKCGINLDNTDTGAITGYDAGGSTVKTKESIVPESGKLNTSFTASSFTTSNGLTFRLYKTTNLTADELYIWRALKTWWADAALKLIKDSYGYSFKDSDATVKDITIQFTNDKAGKYLAYTDYPKNINGHYSLTLAINKAYFNNFSSSDVNGESKNQGYLDRIIAHELTHAIMMAKVDTYKDLPAFITEGLAELTQGIDDLRRAAILTLAQNSSKLKTYSSLTAGGGYAYAAGYIFLRYLAKQGAANYASPSDDSDNVTIKGSVLTVSKSYVSSKLDLSKYSSSVKTVNAKALSKSIMIVGNNNANSIVSGSGNDTLSGGKGNDTLTGGKGDDVFIYTAGKDVITDYATCDRISLGADISKATVNGSDVIFTTTAGTLTIKKAAGKVLGMIDSSGESFSATIDENNLFVTNDTISPVTVGSSVEIIDASKRTTAVKITGNSKANTISGGAGKDTIYGAGGNDSIVGNDGNDKLYGDAGKDIILGGAGNDKLYGGTGNDSLYGDAGNDKLFGDAGKDLIWGGTGNDSILGDDGHDKLYGNTGKDSIWGGAGNDSIFGNEGNDELYGDAGKDSIRGGAGDDSLWGGADSDTFYYASGDGNDVIYGFEDDDLLKITGVFSASYNKSKKELAFKVGSTTGAITLKDFSATTFNINNTDYKISGSKLVKK